MRAGDLRSSRCGIGKPRGAWLLCRLGSAVRHPMLKLTFFSERRFSVALAAESLGTFGLLGALFLQTQFLQFDLGNSPLQAGLRILPMAVMLVLAALLSPIIARSIGVKCTVAAGLAAVAGGLWQISAVATVATTYGDVVPGLLLLGLGAGLLLPTATNSVVGSVPQGDSGMGSATNAVALQVGGALGVAVIGSVMATRYQHRMSAALAGRHVPMDATHTILGSFGGALAVADSVRGATGALLSHAARGRVHERRGVLVCRGICRGPRRRCHRARLATFARLPAGASGQFAQSPGRPWGARRLKRSCSRVGSIVAFGPHGLCGENPSIPHVTRADLIWSRSVLLQCCCPSATLTHRPM